MSDFYFLETKADGEVLQWQRVVWEMEGPPAMPDPMDGNVIHALSGPPQWPARKSPTAILFLVGDAVEWKEPMPLDDLKATAIAQTYHDVDGVYDAAIGRRATEYASAEVAAREYLAVDVKPEAVSGYITGHARSNPTGQQQTNEWAAQQIIARADAFRWAELQMRNVRFDRQADMRAATTPEELAAAVGAWTAFIAQLRGTLGL